MTVDDRHLEERYGHRGPAVRAPEDREDGALPGARAEAGADAGSVRAVRPNGAIGSDDPAARSPAGNSARLPVDDPLAGLSPTAVRVLTAAQRILAERGLASLTLNAVAEESGENKAMTKYYFGNKAGLIAALVDAAVHDECLESASRMQGVTDEDRIARLVEELQHMSEAGSGFLAFFDILPHALRNEQLRPRLATLYEWYLQLKLDWLGLDPEADARRRAELRPLAQLLSAVIDGMAVQSLIDPERFDIDAAYAMLERILTSVLPDLLAGPESSSDGTPREGQTAGE